jgi:hypothetical protein
MGMEFREFVRMSERTLYHGTVVDNEPTIRKHGLVGGWHGPVGSFVDDAYGGDYEGVDPGEDDEVVYAADRRTLGKSVGAMVFHIGRKLGKDFHDVSDNDIRNHGLLVLVKDMDLEPYDPHVWRDRVPRGAEEGDYYDSRMGGDVFLKGSALVRFLRRNGEWPRDWGVDSGDRWRFRDAREGMRRDVYGDDYSPLVKRRGSHFDRHGMPDFLNQSP